MKIVPIILAGGFGTRLWPQSRILHPKQFLPFNGKKNTLLQSTLQRVQDLDTTPPIVICNEEHRFLAAEQLRQIGIEDANILLEQKSRNTAPAITLAALLATQLYDDCTLLVLAADHYFSNQQNLEEAILLAHKVAQNGSLVTFGVKPDRPETGYGYIKLGGKISNAGVFEVSAFVEKPDINIAQQYLESGQYLWNSGNFLFTSKSYLQAVQEYANEVYQCCEAAVHGPIKDLNFIRFDEQKLANCPSISIDYAVMEQADNLAVIALELQWKDLGSWASLWEMADKDVQNNALTGDVITVDSSDNYIAAYSKLVTTLGVHNLVIVETQDAILVADKTKTQEVKQIVERLQQEQRREAREHLKTYRPWGSYECVDRGERYQVKRITVKAGAKLSTQLHHHRAEHWVVVKGTAKVTCGNKTFILSENQSTYIPIGKVHTLENPGKIPLELIEVQSGAYLGEDDIVRLKDEYGRQHSK